MASGSIDETEEEIRLRHAACLLSDIAWRSHPEYRAQRALNVVTQGQFVAIDHPSRAFLTLAIVLRHDGPDGGDAIASMRSLLTTRLLCGRVFWALLCALGICSLLQCQEFCPIQNYQQIWIV